MMLCGALDRAASTPNGPKFVIKGGVALELRLPGRARATNDLDIVAMCADNDLVATLDEALRTPYFNCSFTRRAATKSLGDKAIRVFVHIDYQSQRWATVQIDRALPEATDTETDKLPGISLAPFGLEGPSHLNCISIRHHSAQKLHGMTKISYDGSENDRFRDAVDLLLLKDLLATEELTSVRRACEDTFHIRAEHAWPPEVGLPKHWRDPFKSMAQSVGLSITSIDDAETEPRALLDSIVNVIST